MGRVNEYLLKHFASLFASLFFTLFFITSIIFFIKIASITAIIKINFYELGLLYIYLLPNILIYTLPVTFFVALCISLFNLSKENEIIVLFTLGYKPKKIAKLFIVVSSLLSTLLIVNIILLIPTAEQLNDNFIDYKKAEAKFNIKPTQTGQRFSDWLVYLDQSDEKDKYSGIVMHQAQTPENTEKIIIAKNANISSDGGTLRLKLDNGKAFEISPKKIEQIDFEKMYLKSKSKSEISKVEGIVSYWKLTLTDKEEAYDLAFLLLIALFPVSTVLFAISIGIVTYRYERSGIYIPMIAVIAGYLAPGFILVEYANLPALLIVFLISMTVSYLFYRQKIALRY